jgi:nitroreductase
MDCLKFIYERRSIRSFKDIPVDGEKIGKILDAGRLAPSAGNLQEWKFILVKDSDMIKKIASACFEQFWISSAPFLIVVCSEPSRPVSHYGEKGEMYSYHNAAAAVENMIIAADMLGLSSCWVGAFENELMKRNLNIPDEVIVHAVLPFGYAAEKPPAPPKLTLEDVVFVENYGNRVKDFPAYFQHFGEHVNKIVKKGKNIIKNFSKKLKE